MRMERLRAEFFDIGAVIYFLRKVIWTVPGLHRRALPRTAARDARADRGRAAVFVAHSTRLLVEARKP